MHWSEVIVAYHFFLANLLLVRKEKEIEKENDATLAVCGRRVGGYTSHYSIHQCREKE
jgi:hypothetical protein